VKQGWHGDSYTSWPWALRGLFRRDNRVYQYISYRRSGHGGTPFVESISRELDGFSLVKIPAERFVAAEFDYTGGTLTTEPLIFTGDRLTLNLDTSAVGEARVGIVRADSSPIDGFKVSDCDVMNGDYLDRKVTWSKKGDVSSLAGLPVRLRFEMRGTKLYAFQFGR
jgi:hypothetical protein